MHIPHLSVSRLRHVLGITVFAVMLPVLQGCKDITSVQTGYVNDRDSCHLKAEGMIGVYFTSYSFQASERDKNGTSFLLFCECMKDKGWKIGGCPKPATATAESKPAAAPLPPSAPAKDSAAPNAPPPSAPATNAVTTNNVTNNTTTTTSTATQPPQPAAAAMQPVTTTITTTITTAPATTR